MQKFESFFAAWLKKSKIPFIKLNSIPYAGDFLIQLKELYIVELKNHSKFSYNTWRKKQVKQYSALKEFDSAFLITTEDASRFNDVMLHHIKSETCRISDFQNLKSDIRGMYLEWFFSGK